MGQELAVTCKQVGLGLVRLVGEGGMIREPGAVLGGEASGRRQGDPAERALGDSGAEVGALPSTAHSQPCHQEPVPRQRRSVRE